MKNLLFLILLISSCSANAQVRFFFGPSAISTAEETKEQMDKLIKKSYIFTFYFTGDSIADSMLIHDVILMSAGYDSYCVLYKDDTTHVAISINTLNNGDYKVTTYYKNRDFKRTALYTKDIIKTGKWFFYYDNKWLRQVRVYKNGKRDGKWKYYNDSGNVTLVEHYKNGLLVKSSAK